MEERDRCRDSRTLYPHISVSIFIFFLFIYAPKTKFHLNHWSRGYSKDSWTRHITPLMIWHLLTLPARIYFLLTFESFLVPTPTHVRIMVKAIHTNLLIISITGNVLSYLPKMLSPFPLGAYWNSTCLLSSISNSNSFLQTFQSLLSRYGDQPPQFSGDCPKFQHWSSRVLQY